MTDIKANWDHYYRRARDNKSKDSAEQGPSEFLQQNIQKFTPGKVLDIAMGLGRNSFFLAEQGLRVKGFDISPYAAEDVEARARLKGLEIEAKAADLDLFLMGIMEYDHVVMADFKPATTRYYNEIIRALKQGGFFLVDFSPSSKYMEDLKSQGLNLGYFAPNELLRHLGGLRVWTYQEEEVSGHLRVKCLAQKPMDKDAAKYGLFDMQSKVEKTENAHINALEGLFKK